MGFFHINSEKDLDALFDRIRKVFKAAKRGEVAINSVDGNVSAPSQRNKHFRVQLAFNPDQFDRDVKNIRMKSIKELIESVIYVLAFPIEQKNEKENNSEVIEIENIPES
jgi:hypothetical protein